MPIGNKGTSSKQRKRRGDSYQKRIEKDKLRSTAGYSVKLSNGWITMSEKVVHPGFSRRGFMAAGFSASQPIYNAEMQKAVQNAFNEVSK
jgi:hypothetical protein